MSLEKTLASIQAKFGKESIIKGNDVIPIDRLSTGSLGLDIATGGGWGEGRMVEIYGPESVGKTTLVIHSMIEAQKKYPNKWVAIIDSENAFDSEYAAKLGLDTSRLIVNQPDNGEQGLDIAEELIGSNELSLLAVDSIATLVPKAEIEGEMGDSIMGKHALLMSKGLRKLVKVVNTSKTVVMFLNQTREKIGCVSPDTVVSYKIQ